jgi:hypothetical protein
MTAALNTQGNPEKFQTRNSSIWFGEDGIVRQVSSGVVTENFEDASESIDITISLADGRKRPPLVDIGKPKSISIVARRLYAEECPKYFSVIALVAGSRLTRALGNFFLMVNRPAVESGGR